MNQYSDNPTAARTLYPAAKVPNGVAASTAQALQALRSKLLDIGKRNHLIHTPLENKRARHLNIVDELSDEIFKLISQRRESLSFLPIPEQRGSELEQSVNEDFQSVYLPPEDDEVDSAGLASRHIDTKLQTPLTREALQKKLLTLYRDATAIEDEQGVSILYLALGFLHWYESENSDVERSAPLILLPVDLKRDSVRGHFRLELREQDLEPNLSLRALLANDFEIGLPDLPEGDDWLPSDYHQLVREAIDDKPRWSVAPDRMVLGSYSFAKFLMWRDLDPDVWPAGKGFAGNALIEKLLTDGFEAESPHFTGEECLDQTFANPRDLGHILDADASQTQVIAAARRGQNLVVQGPPGTGKSQTIANVIATAVRDGKRVLFVAEKRAALEVVYDRLAECDLGPLCLELHSRSANKKCVLEELKRTLELGPPAAVDVSSYDAVRSLRDELNEYSSLLHQVDETTGETPFKIIGRIAELREKQVPLPDFDLPDSVHWNLDQAQTLRQAVGGLARLTKASEPQAKHIWRGVTKRLSPMEQQRLERLLSESLSTLNALSETLEAAARATNMQSAQTQRSTEAIKDRLRALNCMPSNVPELLRNSTALSQLDRAVELAESLKTVQSLKSELLIELSEPAFEMAWTNVRSSIAAHGTSTFRLLNREFRAAVAQLRSVCRSKLPHKHEDQVSLLDRLLELNRLRSSIIQENEFGRQVFGESWRGEATRVDTILPSLHWIASQLDSVDSIDTIKHAINNFPSGFDVAATLQTISALSDDWDTSWSNILKTIGLNLMVAFGVDDVGDIEWRELKKRLSAWTLRTEELENWYRLSTAAGILSENGLDELRVRIADGRIHPDDAENTFLYARAESIWDYLCKNEPKLKTLDGDRRTQKVLDFQQSDEQLKQLAAQELAWCHYNSLPQGSSGQMGLVRGEIGKKSRHMPLRKLMDRAGEAISQIKPVFLMSPLSIAQFLKPGGLHFDLLVIDEASQVKPEDALGAIARASQVIVVGDKQQMPPSSFFERQVEGDSSEGQDELDDAEITARQVGDMESVLTLCDARSMPGATLRWHYRSKHPSLIQVSNHLFYDGKLIFPPSPDESGTKSGLTLVKVDGIYERGSRRCNVGEAKAVAKAVLEHARSRPGESLGVVTLSSAQQDAIQNELEHLRAEHSELEAFCVANKREQFFVKSLEHVQGDEREHIFISVGYARDKDNYMSQSFGPVCSEGGERRLNVLFTRAKQCCRVFSSITHHDIRDDATRHVGPSVLKRFLKYAETGELDIPIITGGEMDSPFEEAVANALVRRGFSVESQVGSAGFLIDLAVYDRVKEGHFLLGIECDGARYHSSRWARERDRLRQIVLESKGWTIHRIWSTDWFQKPEAEMQKLLNAIEVAQMGQPAVQIQKAAANVSIEREQVTRETGDDPVRYVEATFDIIESALHELHEASTESLMRYVNRIVEEEGPIHVEEVGRRLSRLWGYQRTGKRVQDIVSRVIQNSVASGHIQHCPIGGTDFVDSVSRAGSLAVRDRESVSSSTLRKVQMFPPSEVQAAIILVVDRNIAISTKDCAVEVARLFGIKSTREELRSLVDQHLEQLVALGKLVRSGTEVKLACSVPTCTTIE